jgi:hypothetical protein
LLALCLLPSAFLGRAVAQVVSPRLLPRRPEFEFGSGHVGIVDKTALRQVPFEYQFPLPSVRPTNCGLYSGLASAAEHGTKRNSFFGSTAPRPCKPWPRRRHMPAFFMTRVPINTITVSPINSFLRLRFEVVTAVTVKTVAFWDVTP